MILKSETYHFHRLDLTRQAGFIVTIYDEDGMRLAATAPFATPAEAFTNLRRVCGHNAKADKLVDARLAAPMTADANDFLWQWGTICSGLAVLTPAN